MKKHNSFHFQQIVKMKGCKFLMKKYNLRYYLNKNKIPFTLIIIFSITSSIMTILAPIYIGNIIDNAIPLIKNKMFNEMLKLIIIYVALFVSNIILNNRLVLFATNISKNLRSDLFEKINNLPLKYLDKTRYGDVINRFTVDIENISNGLIQAISKITMGVVTVIVSIIIMIRLNITITVILICIAPIMYFISKFIGTNTKNLFENKANTISNINGYTEEVLSGIKTVKNFSYEEIANKKFKEKNEKLKKVGIKSQFYSSLTNPATRFVSNLSYIIVAITGIILIKMEKGLTIGNLTTFLVYTNVFTRPFNEITSIISEIQAAIASAKRAFKFLNENEENIEVSNSKMKSIEGKIEFKNVYFSYNKDKKFIENLNLAVKPKEKIAIVGKTGAGKTTIVNLIMRFYEIDKGEILIDGVNIKEIPIDKLRKNIGIVLQDTKLFTGTIKENISYGKPDATDEEIRNAAKMAYANEFIERLPQGYDTVIQNQNMLSEGEVQLINIARIMLLKPPILILDEATSNIDVVTENKIGLAFTKLMENSTSFIIAHRLSTIKNADRIIYIENGNIVEEGTDQELINKKGKYFELYNV